MLGNVFNSYEDSSMKEVNDMDKEDASRGDDNLKKIINSYKQELEECSLEINDDLDTEHITSIVDKLESLDCSSGDYSSIAALEDFRKNYMPTAEGQSNLLEEKRLYAEKMLKHNSSPSLSFYLKRVAAVFIIAFGSLCVTSVAVYSFSGINIFKPFIEWGNDTFNRTYSEDSFFELKTLMEAENISILKPNYYLEGFVVTDNVYEKNELTNDINIKLVLQESDKFISYYVQIFGRNPNGRKATIEKNALDVEVFQQDGIDFYSFENNNWNVIAWNHSNVEYSLAGNVSVELLKKIIETLE